jgi:hypothetical protein
MSALSKNADPGSAASVAPASAPPKKRRRPPVACEQCRSRKIRCDKLAPCSHCTQSGNPEQCTYAPTHGPKKKQQAPGQVPDPNLSQYAARRAGLALSTASDPGMSHEPSPPVPSQSASEPVASSMPTAASEPQYGDLRRQAEASALQEQGGYRLVLHQSVAAPAERDVTSNDGEGIAHAFEDVTLKDKFIGQSHWKNGFLDFVSPRTWLTAQKHV